MIEARPEPGAIGKRPSLPGRLGQGDGEAQREDGQHRRDRPGPPVFLPSILKGNHQGETQQKCSDQQRARQIDLAGQNRQEPERRGRHGDPQDAPQGHHPGARLGQARRKSRQGGDQQIGYRQPYTQRREDQGYLKCSPGEREGHRRSQEGRGAGCRQQGRQGARGEMSGKPAGRCALGRLSGPANGQSARFQGCRAGGQHPKGGNDPRSRCQETLADVRPRPAALLGDR